MDHPKIPVPANEEERLEILKRYAVMDTIPEKEFDDITKLASAICGTPITLISLLDQNRQWFKSRVGLDATETPRNISFCQHAIMQHDIFEIEDATNDDRFAENPLVTGAPDIRFYAGAPLTTDGGYNLGTLCVIDIKPNKLSPEQREALQILARQVVANMELRKEKNRVENESRLLAESNDLLNAFLENSPSNITMRDPAGRYLYVNASVLKANNKTKADFIGHSIREFATPELAAEILGDDQTVLSTKKTIRKEYKTGEGDNQRHYVSYLFPLLNADHEAYGVATITNEVTAEYKKDLELKKSNERFQKIFNSSPIGMNIVSIQDSKIIQVNKSFLDLFGFDNEKQALGHSAQELGITSQEAIDGGREQMSKQGFIQNQELHVSTKKGKPVSLLCSVNIIEMSDAPVLLVSYFDVTESKKLEQEIKTSHERFTSIFYNSPNGICIANIDSGELLMVNHAFLNIFGFEERDVLGRSAAQLNLVPDAGTRQIHMEDVKKYGRVKDREIKVRRKNGDEMYCLTSIEFIEIGGKKVAISAFQDITERRKIELQLIEARKEAEQATLSKSSFLANMSHEIRTPLNAMLGFADLLEATPLNEQQKDYLNAIDTSGKNLLTIINDILDFSKIEAGMLSIESVPFGPQSLIHSVYTMFFAKAQSKNLKLFISIDPKLPPLVNGDPTRLNQIMINLIGNAVKFTSEGSVSVDCEVVNRSAEKVKIRFSVKDTGIGITPEKIKAIFDRFTQAESDITRNYGGTGLGLSIAKKLIELQGGEIHVNSTPGKGSEFYFIIEYAIADEKEYTPIQSGRPEKPEGHFLGKKVLIVEDNALNQKLALTLLKNEGFVAEIAENGQIAVDMLKDRSYDIILMDIQMPVLDGYQATKKIRRELNIKTPIIAMTANAMAGEQERCIDIGMDDYITKPFKSDSLLNIIYKAMNHSSAQVIQLHPETAAAANMRVSDLNYLREFSGGKEDFVKEMVEVFLEQNPIDVKALEDALDTDNFAVIRSLAHSLQTSLGFIGFSEKLIQNLKETEMLAIEKKDPDTIRNNMHIIIAACRQAQAELREELKSLH